MTLALVAVIVWLITALATDCVYTIICWLCGRPGHSYQRPHHPRRYAFIVSIIATEVALITVLAVVLVRVVAEPGMAL